MPDEILSTSAPETPAAAPAEQPVAPPEPTTEPVKEEAANGSEGKEPAAEGAAPAPTQDAPADTETLGDEIFEGITYPKDQLDKLRSALGDARAYEIVSELQAVEEIKTAIGAVPTLEELQGLSESTNALRDLYNHIETDPQKAIDFFLGGDDGKLDPTGAKFVKALADGVRMGTVPQEARVEFARSVSASLLKDVETARAEFLQEQKYAEQKGFDQKAENFKIRALELEIVSDYLKNVLSGKGGIDVQLSRPPKDAPAASPVQEQLPTESPEFTQFLADQKQYNQGVMLQVVDSYVSKLPDSVPSTLKEAAQVAIQQKVRESIQKNENPALRLAHGNFTAGHKYLLEGNSAAAEVAFKKGYTLFRTGVTQVAAQHATPILNELKVSLSTKSQELVAGRQAGESKTPVLDTSAAGAGVGQATGDSDPYAARPGESRQAYIERVFKAQAAKR